MSEGFVSANNSTSTPLAPGGVFTGAADEVKDFGAVTCFVYADANSVVDGLSFRWSSDAANWDLTDNYSITASGAQFFTFPIKARYFSLVFTNNSAAQLNFRLQTIYHTDSITANATVADTDAIAMPIVGTTIGRVDQGTGNAASSSWAVSGNMGISGTDGVASTKLIRGFTSVAVFDERVRSLLEELVLLLIEKSCAESTDADADPPLERMSAVAHGIQPLPAAAGSTLGPISNIHGIPFILEGHPNLQTIRVNYTSAQTDVAIVTPNANQIIVATSIEFTLDKTCSVNVAARVGFGTTTTPAGVGVIASHPGIDPGGGLVKGNGGGIIGIGIAGDPLRITSGVPTGGSLDVVASYFLIED